jgi:dihydrofolate synthase / folylpolyglutamate synthase
MVRLDGCSGLWKTRAAPRRAALIYMKVIAIRTGKITPGTQSLEQVLDAHIPPLREGSIVAVTSKIVSICEGRVVAVGDREKADLINEEADWILPLQQQRYNITLTIRDNILIPTAGIDESNGNGFYVLWPANAQKSANAIRTHLKKRFKLSDIGVIITDSKTLPLRRGTVGTALAASGFKALKDYIGKDDIFGRALKVTKANIMEGLAMAAVLAMGEGNEQTPLAVIDEVPFVEFQKKNPTAAELKELKIDRKDDLYAPLLVNAAWKKGKRKHR